MRRAVAFSIIMLLGFQCATAEAKLINFTADFDPDEQSPEPDVGDNDPEGTADFTYDDETKQLCGTVAWTDFTGPAIAVEIHQTPPGEPEDEGDSKIIIPLGSGGSGADGGANSPVSCNFTLDAAFAASLAAGELYATIKTAKNPTGEARGNLLRNAQGPTVRCGAPTNPDGSGNVGDASFTPGAGVPTPRPASGNDAGDAPPGGGDDDGCSATGSTSESSLVIPLLVVVASSIFIRRHHLKKKR